MVYKAVHLQKAGHAITDHFSHQRQTAADHPRHGGDG
jgi:hypothetical protein